MSADFEAVRTQRARKALRCEECRCEVPAGEAYVRMAGCWDGDFFTDKVCTACYDLREGYLRAMHVNSAYEPDEVVYNRGSLIEEVSVYLEYPGVGAMNPTRLAEIRGAMLPLLRDDIRISLRDARVDRECRLPAHARRARAINATEEAWASCRIVQGMAYSARNGPFTTWRGLRRPWEQVSLRIT